MEGKGKKGVQWRGRSVGMKRNVGYTKPGCRKKRLQVHESDSRRMESGDEVVVVQVWWKGNEG